MLSMRQQFKQNLKCECGREFQAVAGILVGPDNHPLDNYPCDNCGKAIDLKSRHESIAQQIEVADEIDKQDQARQHKAKRGS
jgi:hypothetical protein